MPVHVFLSHAGEQKGGIVALLDTALQRAGCTTFLDVNSMVLGNTADETIEPALRGAGLVLLVLTHDFVGKYWPMKELQWALEGDHSKLVAVFCDNLSRTHCKKGSMSPQVQQRLEAGKAEVLAKYPELAESTWQQWVDDLATVAQLGNIDRNDPFKGIASDALLVKEVVRSVCDKLNLHPRNALQSPRASRLFGRDVAAFQEGLHQHRMLQLVAGPGEGKSELASQIGHCLLEEHCCGGGAFWIDLPELQQDSGGSSSHAQVQRQVAAQLTTQMGGAVQLEEWSDVMIWAHQLRAPALLVLDNAENAMNGEALSVDLAKVLSDLRGCPKLLLILASRIDLPHLDGLPPAAIHKLQPIPAPEAHQLLHHHWSVSRGADTIAAQPGDAPIKVDWGGYEDGKCAQELVDRVQRSPLLLRVAGSLVGSGRMTWQDALGYVAHDLFNLGDRTTRPLMKKEALQRWLQHALQPQELTCLRHVCVFADTFSVQGAEAVQCVDAVGAIAPLAAGTNTGWSINHSVKLGPTRPRRGSTENMLQELASLSVLHRQGQRYVLHALVRWAAQSMADSESTVQQLHDTRLRFVEWMVARQDGPGQLLVLHNPRAEQPNLQQCLRVMTEERLNLAEVARLVQMRHETIYLIRPLSSSGSVLQECIFGVAHCLDDIGQYVLAGSLNQAVFKVCAEVLGPKHPDTLSAQNNLASTLQALGDLQAAKQLQEQVLEARIEVLGPKHPDTLSAQNNLANTLQALGDLQAAKQLQEQALEARTEVLGPKHPDTLNTQSNLANTLRALGELQATKQLQERVLEAHTEVFGSKHPEPLRVQSNLANTLHALGDLQAAKQLHEYVLEAYIEVVGPKHPDTLRVQHNLASTLQALGDWHAAKQLQEYVLEVHTKVFGPKHPHTLSTQNDFANTLQALGDLQAAKQSQQQVLEARIEVLGPKHPDTLSVQNDLALTFQTLGDLQAAKQLQEQVLEAQTEVLGPKHPETLRVQHNLANTLQTLGDLQAAKQLQEHVLEARVEVFGPKHRDTLRVQHNLANTMQVLGDLQAAKQLHEHVLEAHVEVFGPKHPDTLAMQSSLASILNALGDLQAAKQLQEQVLQARIEVLGPKHPDTLLVQNNLSNTLQALGDLEAAKQLQEQVLEARTEVLGRKHPDTLIAQHNLANTLQALGNLQAAKQLQEQALEAHIEVLGPKHPETLRVQNNLAITMQILGDLQAAKQLQEQVLEARVEVFGPKHPDTLISQHNLANTLQALGNLQAAKQLQEQALEAHTEVLGPKHPETLRVQSNLVITLHALGDLQAAKQLQEQVLEAHTEVLGPKHPHTLIAQHNLATLQALGDS